MARENLPLPTPPSSMALRLFHAFWFSWVLVQIGECKVAGFGAGLTVESCLTLLRELAVLPFLEGQCGMC